MTTATNNTQKAPRRLSENTIARYNTEQLFRHLDRFLDRAFPENAPYRGLYYYGDIYRLEGDAYVWHCKISDRDALEEVLRDTYSRAR